VSYVTDCFDDEIVRLLKTGGIGLLPSDTIYGLSCMALNEKAVERLHKLKDRSTHKPFIVLISDIKMLDLLSISEKQTEIFEKYWPGPLSTILPSKAPAFLTRGTASLAVRLPDHQELRDLIDKIGPIISTSANIEGGSPIHYVAEARKLFGNKLDFYVDAGELDNPPSTLVAVDSGQLKVIRQGAVKIKDEE
jgi:L-threonylcarbamoyladenylate synthase